MSAGQALQAELVGMLQAVSEFTGIFDGPPARAAYPYLVVDTGSEQDWSAKGLDGREVIVALTLWDDQPARLHRLADSVAELMASDFSPGGWQLVTCRFQRRRILRDVAGPWAAAIDYRARLLAQS